LASYRERYLAIVFIASALAILLVSSFAWINNDQSLLLGIGVITAPSSALLMGVIGLWLFGREDFRREDRFHLMNIFFSLGLVLYSISEIAAGLLANQEGSEAYLFTVSLIQMPGLILWAIGVLGYLRASNSVLQTSNDSRLVGIMIIVPTAAMLLLAFLVMIFNPTRNPIDVFTTAPLAIGMSVITLALGYVLLVFRGGRLSRPLGLAFLAVLVLTIQIVLWCCIALSPVEPLGQVVRAEAYIILGTALIAAKSIEIL
jgi:MFS family permease